MTNQLDFLYKTNKLKEGVNYGADYSWKKGKGKTKHLLDKANAAITEAKGSIVYLDKSSKHMYELSNKIRLINVKGFDVTDSSGFIGFIS